MEGRPVQVDILCGEAHSLSIVKGEKFSCLRKGGNESLLPLRVSLLTIPLLTRRGFKPHLVQMEGGGKTPPPLFSICVFKTRLVDGGLKRTPIIAGGLNQTLPECN